MPAAVTRVQDVGTYLLVTGTFEGGDSRVRAAAPGQRRGGAGRHGLADRAQSPHTCFYRDEELIR